MISQRRIRLPNIVQSTNTTLSCHVQNGLVDFGTLADFSAPTDCVSQLLSDHFFVTFSEVSSNFNGIDYVNYNEIIIKLPVILGDRPFIFPPRTYVDNELSLIRGYQLGFNKYMTVIDKVMSQRVSFDGIGLQIRAEIRPHDSVKQTAALATASEEFILSDDNGTAMRLVVSDYIQDVDTGWIGASGSGIITGYSFDVMAARRTADCFILHHRTTL